MVNPKILLIDDDQKLAALLESYLKRFEMTLSSCQDPRDGIALLRDVQGDSGKSGKESFDLLILDLMLPGMDGFEVCREIRRFSEIPIIMLTARGDTTDRVVGLEMGADDYIPKPFEPRELVARIQTVLRRVRPSLEREAQAHGARAVKGYSSGKLILDLVKHSGTLEGEALHLTTTEFELLKLFMSHPGEALSRDRIMDELRGVDWEAFNRSIDVAMSRLRSKLGDSAKDPKFFQTVWGEGYRFIASVEVLK